jgi:hypothetical protein
MPVVSLFLDDNQGHIYVERLPSILESDPQWKFDVFGKDGSFLHRVELPLRPHLIRDGYLYMISAEETIRSGKVTRDKILNWDRLKITQ